MIVQALKNEDITIYCDGFQTRSFCYVDDLVDALVLAMNSSNFTGPVNLGNPIELTMIELAEKIINLTNSNSQLIYKQLPENDPQQRKPDISLAKKELNWIPVTSLDEGLLKTINYFQERIK